MVGFELYRFANGKLIGDPENPQPELVCSGIVIP